MLCGSASSASAILSGLAGVEIPMHTSQLSQANAPKCPSGRLAGVGQSPRVPVAGSRRIRGRFPSDGRGDTPPPPRRSPLRASCEVVSRPRGRKPAYGAASRRFRGDRAGAVPRQQTYPSPRGRSGFRRPTPLRTIRPRSQERPTERHEPCTAARGLVGVSESENPKGE